MSKGGGGSLIRIMNYEVREFLWEGREFDSKIRWRMNCYSMGKGMELGILHGEAMK